MHYKLLRVITLTARTITLESDKVGNIQNCNPFSPKKGKEFHHDKNISAAPYGIIKKILIFVLI